MSHDHFYRTCLLQDNTVAVSYWGYFVLILTGHRIYSQNKQKKSHNMLIGEKKIKVAHKKMFGKKVANFFQEPEETLNVV